MMDTLRNEDRLTIQLVVYTGAPPPDPTARWWKTWQVLADLAEWGHVEASYRKIASGLGFHGDFSYQSVIDAVECLIAAGVVERLSAPRRRLRLRLVPPPCWGRSGWGSWWAPPHPELPFD